MLTAARSRHSHPRGVPGGILVRDVRDCHRGIAALGGDGEEVGEPLGRRPPGPLPLHRCAGTRIERHVADGGVHPRSVVHLGPSRVAVVAVVVVVALGEEEAVIVVVIVACAAGRRRRFRRLRERMTAKPSSSSGGGGGGGATTRRPSIIGLDLRGSVVESDGDA